MGNKEIIYGIKLIIFENQNSNNHNSIFSCKSKTSSKSMPGEKMHPSLLRVNQHTERVRKELREMTSEMNHFYQRYSGLDEENEFLRESLVSLLNRINDESVSKELSDLGQEIRSKLGEFE